MSGEREEHLNQCWNMENSGVRKRFRKASDRLTTETVLGRLGDEAKWICEPKCMWFLKGATLEDEDENWNSNERGEEEYEGRRAVEREERIDYIWEVRGIDGSRCVAADRTRWEGTGVRATVRIKIRRKEY